MGIKDFISARELYSNSTIELEEFVRPKVVRILLLTFLFYPISFIFLGKWAHLKRWSFIGWLYLSPLATFFAMAIASAIARPVGHDPYKAIAIYMGIAIPFLWPVALVHAYKIRFKYTVLSASQSQLQEWIEQVNTKRAEEKRWEEEYQAEKARQENANAERRDRQRLEDEKQKKIWEEIQRERHTRQQQTHGSHNRSKTKAHSKSQTSDDSRWISNDPFTVLGIPRGSSDEQVRKAWLKLIHQWHPDRAASTSQSNQELYKARSQKINWARNQCQGSSINRKAA